MKTVPLGGRKAAGRVALVDDEDYDLVMQYRWHVQETHEISLKTGEDRIKSGPYAVRGFIRDGHHATQFMHNLIMGAKGIDHRNHDTLDNRRENLRFTSHSLNAANQQLRTDGTSRYKGVSLEHRRGRWVARVQIEGRRTFLGYFASEEDAARAYNAKAAELHGAHAWLNPL